MDILELIKKTNLLNNNENMDNQNEIENMIKLFSMMNSINSTNAKDNNTSQDENSLLKLENKNIKSIKAVMPYLDTEYKEKIYSIINFMEISDLLKEYKKTLINTEDKNLSKLKQEAILHIKEYINEENRHFADLAIKTMEIKEIIYINSKNKEN